MDITTVKQRFGLVGNDPQIDQAINTAMLVAPIQLSVLILGESGSGKEVFPQIIHHFSRRAHAPYVAVNCGAIPEGTIDSELFGHVKGSFTGAVGERKGYFEEADGGTIFLDEIGELPLSTQAKLLRVLEKGEYMRMGSSTVQRTDVRVVAATNVDLEAAIRKGTFRQDLYYRLNGISIRIPPLSQRRSDIPVLFQHFADTFADMNKIPPIRLTPDAVELLLHTQWDGNVRQLRNVAHQVTALARSREVDREEIERFVPKNSGNTLLPLPDGQAQTSFSSERELLYKILFDLRKDVSDMKSMVTELLERTASTQNEVAPTTTPAIGHKTSHNVTHEIAHEVAVGPEITRIESNHRNQVSRFNTRNMDVQDAVVQDDPKTIYITERELIIRALDHNYGNRRATAKELGMSERTLYRRIRELGIDA